MASGQHGAVLRTLDRIFGDGGLAGLTESELLGRFVGRRDESAFEALVARHGPMVLGVCRRVLGGGDAHAAEDAFQAVFLILVKKAGSIRDGDRLGPWLHGVARRVALRARAVANRRREVERPGAEEAAVAAPDVGDGLGFGLDPELRAVLDEEVDRLPEKYRAPVVLCYLEGLTHDQAALRLGWPVGTVRSRMAWARDKLRGRLARRGLAGSAAAVAAALGGEAAKATALAIGAELAPAVSPALLHQTIRAAMHVASHPSGTLAAGAASASAADLAKGALHAMFMHKIKVGALALAALCATAGGGFAVVMQDGKPGRDAREADKSDDRPEAEAAERFKLAQERARVRQLEEGFARQGEVIEALRAELKESDMARIAAETRAKFEQTRAQKFADLLEDLQVELTQIEQAVRRPSAGVGVGAGGPSVPGAPAAGAQGQGAGVVAVEGLGQAAPAAGAAVGGLGGDAVTVPAGMPGMLGPMGGPAGMGAISFRGKVPTLMGQSIIATVPEGAGRVWAFSAKTGTWADFPIGEGVTKATPILGMDDLLALQLEGDAVDRLAAFTAKSGGWYEQALNEPIDGTATPIVGPGAAAYAIGRTVYAFSAEAERWDVLTLPGDGEPARPMVHPAFVLVEDGDTLHTFSIQTGRWSSLDAKAGGDATRP